MHTCYGARGQLQSTPMTEQWIVYYCGFYAEYDMHKKYGKEKNFDGHIERVCSDKRRTNTVIHKLHEAGVRNIATGEPIEAKIRGIVQTYKFTAPVFEDTGWKKENSYSNPTPLKNAYEVYRRLGHLYAAEMIYVWLHQDEFVFKMIPYEKKRYYSLGGKDFDIEKHLAIYPKSKEKVIVQNISLAYLDEFIRKHPSISMTALTGRTVDTISPNDRDYTDKNDDGAYDFKSIEKIGIAEIGERVKDVQRRVSLYQKALEELRAIQEAIQGVSEGSIQDHIREKTLEHLRKCAPLYVNSEEEDIRDMIKEVLKGTDPKVLFDKKAKPKSATVGD